MPVHFMETHAPETHTSEMANSALAHLTSDDARRPRAMGGSSAPPANANRTWINSDATVGEFCGGLIVQAAAI